MRQVIVVPIVYDGSGLKMRLVKMWRKELESEWGQTDYRNTEHANEYANEPVLLNVESWMFSIGDAAGAAGSGGWETILGKDDPASPHSAASGSFQFRLRRRRRLLRHSFPRRTLSSMLITSPLCLNHANSGQPFYASAIPATLRTGIPMHRFISIRIIKNRPKESPQRIPIGSQ